MAIKVLFIGANPEDTDGVYLPEEIRKIDNELQAAKYRDNIALKMKLAARLKDVAIALAEEEPDIVYFSGHGDENGELLLQDKDEFASPVKASDLANIFATVGQSVKLVLINVCNSNELAKDLSKEVPYCIGTSDEIASVDGIEFAVVFFRLLAAGKSVLNAFNAAIHSIDEPNNYKLHTKKNTVPADELVFVSPDKKEEIELSVDYSKTCDIGPPKLGFNLTFYVANHGSREVKNFAIDFIAEKDSFSIADLMRENEHHSRINQGIVEVKGIKVYRFTSRLGEILYPGAPIKFATLFVRSDRTEVISARYVIHASSKNFEGQVEINPSDLAQSRLGTIVGTNNRTNENKLSIIDKMPTSFESKEDLLKLKDWWSENESVIRETSQNTADEFSDYLSMLKPVISGEHPVMKMFDISKLPSNARSKVLEDRNKVQTGKSVVSIQLLGWKSRFRELIQE